MCGVRSLDPDSPDLASTQARFHRDKPEGDGDITGDRKIAGDLALRYSEMLAREAFRSFSRERVRIGPMEFSAIPSPLAISW